MKSKLFINGTPISKIQDQVFVELDNMIQPGPEGLGLEELIQRKARSMGRVEGLGLAISILTGGDCDAAEREPGVPTRMGQD